MEFVSSKPYKVSSRISGIFHRFAKVGKPTPSGVVSGCGEVTHDPHIRDGATEGTECGDDAHNSKIHPQPVEDMSSDGGVDLDVVVAHKLFDAISSLKLAYIQFQQAHIPYDPEKIRSADELLVLQLESLSDIELLYLEKQKTKPKTLASLNAEILEQQELLEKLQAQAQYKDSEVLRLEWEVEELSLKNIELEDEMERTSLPEEEVLLSHQDLTPKLFLLAFEAASKSIHDFGKPLIGLMKASGWDLDCAAGSIVASVTYAERSHKKYAFESYLSRKMFGTKGFPEERFRTGNIGGIMRFRDPFDALIEDPDSNFARFCLLKYVSVVHPHMEYSFFGNLDQREFILSGRHPRTPFYRAFVKMARWVWVLHVMAASIVPKAKMFLVERGSRYTEGHMDSVVKVEETEKSKVEFTVTPGFRIGSEVIRCRVYLSRSKQSLGANQSTISP